MKMMMVIKIPIIVIGEDNSNHVKIVRRDKVVESKLMKILYPCSRIIVSLSVVIEAEIMKHNTPNIIN